MDFKILWENLENHTKDDLCDIYWNLADNVWDRRIGRKPKEFDNLPISTTRFKKKSKEAKLEPYIKKIESLTTEKERRKYLMVVIQKCLTATKFEEWWEEIETMGITLPR